MLDCPLKAVLRQLAAQTLRAKWWRNGNRSKKRIFPIDLKPRNSDELAFDVMGNHVLRAKLRRRIERGQLGSR
jgi:hypothetical protein